jgi:high-affinity nickel-transport protein
MTSALLILGIGFFLGMRHATDPDHVIAVSTIVSREKSIPRAGWIGVLWGVGHTITILVVGVAIILFGFVIPPRVGLALEFSVALMLILLGVLNLTGAMKWISHKLSPMHPDLISSRAGEHSHLHFHGAKMHVHPHSHEDRAQHHARKEEVDPPHWLAEPFVKLGWFHSLRPLLVGIVHGLAGSAAVALLVLGTIHDARWAIFYLLLFGIGTIVGMMLMTLAFAAPVTAAGNRFAWISRTMVTGTGVLSLVFGLVVAYQIGIVDGLFSSHPSWTPH